MQSDYAQSYRDLYHKHWWWRAREEFVIQQIERHGARRDGHVLDIGCGDGLFFPRLENYGSVEGVEADSDIVSANGPYSEKIYCGYFDQDFEPERPCSLIVALDVLEHMPDPVGAMRHAVSLLESDGLMVITVPAFRSLWTKHDDLNHHYTRYTKVSFQQVAEEAGFRIHDCRYFYHWLYPMKLAVRAKEAIAQSDAQNPRVPFGLFNRIAYHWSRFEQRFLTPCQLPFGSSLMIVGSRASSPARTPNDTKILDAACIP